MTRPRFDGVRGAVVVLASLLAALCLTVPGSRAAFTARVTNSTNTVASLPFFTCSAAILSSSPRIYYKLDETGTTTLAEDSSGQDRDGTYQGTTTKGVSRACTRDVGTAVTFNGTSGYVNFGTSLNVPATTYSAELWFKTTSTRGGFLSGFGASATGGSLTVDRVLYLTNDGNVVFGVNAVAKNTIISPAAYRDGSWHHVLATAGPAGLRLYVDGAQAATSTATAPATSGFFRVAFDSLLLWPSAPASNYFAGTLDEVAAYTTTLTATDALNHYRAGV